MQGSAEYEARSLRLFQMEEQVSRSWNSYEAIACRPKPLPSLRMPCGQYYFPAAVLSMSILPSVYESVMSRISDSLRHIFPSCASHKFSVRRASWQSLRKNRYEN